MVTKCYNIESKHISGHKYNAYVNERGRNVRYPHTRRWFAIIIHFSFILSQVMQLRFEWHFDKDTKLWKSFTFYININRTAYACLSLCLNHLQAFSIATQLISYLILIEHNALWYAQPNIIYDQVWYHFNHNVISYVVIKALSFVIIM